MLAVLFLVNSAEGQLKETAWVLRMGRMHVYCALATCWKTGSLWVWVGGGSYVPGIGVRSLRIGMSWRGAGPTPKQPGCLFSAFSSFFPSLSY